MAMLCCASECEHVRGLLVRAGMLNKSLRNCKQPDGRLAIPHLPQAAAELTRPAAEGGAGLAPKYAKGDRDGEEVREVRELRDLVQRGLLAVACVQTLEVAGKVGGKPSPYQRLVSSLLLLLERAAGGGGEGGEAASVKKSVVEGEGAVPRKWEEYKDMIVLPEGALESALWECVAPALLWRTAAEALGVARIAVKGEVDAGRMRQSHVVIKHPPCADGWVTVAQNGLTYTFDVTRVMFSRAT
jgi:hypothetical protein